MNDLATNEPKVEKIEITFAEPSFVEMTEITPYWRNPRKNSEAVEAVRRSIMEYGFNVPIMVDRNNIIITGHTRFRALQELGATHALIVTNDDLTPEKVNEYRIADNATSDIADWDMSLLGIELRDVIVPVMQEFFPSLNLDNILDDIKGSINVQSEVVTNESLFDTQSNLESQFEKRSNEQIEDLVEITCPHCGDDFHISHAVFKGQLKVRADDKAADEREQ